MPVATSASSPDGPPITIDDLTAAFSGGFLDELEQRVRALFRLGHFTSVIGGVATFAVPNAHVIPRCEEVRPELERALHQRFGRPLTVQLVVDASTPPPRGSTPTTAPRSLPEEHIDTSDVAHLENADDVASTGIDRLTRAFPGSTLVAPPPD